MSTQGIGGGLASIGWLAGGALALMSASFAARADQGCPEGLAPIGRAPGPICVPQPGYHGPTPQQAPAAPAATPMPSITMMPYQRPRFYGVHVSDPQRS
ncbi:hypothetical protein [Lysobacter sp. CA199]|uniref:hypothetical protein n=1 Tax=Lysobacter sp. CA199 TaxID=3455608 RepID=UPI003F8D8973